MTESEQPDPVDPKEAMRRALEAKKAAQHASAEAAGGAKTLGGSTHGKAGAKRQFRRKSGG